MVFMDTNLNIFFRLSENGRLSLHPTAHRNGDGMGVFVTESQKHG